MFSLYFLPSCLFSLYLPLAYTIFMLRGVENKDLLQKVVIEGLCLNLNRRLDALKAIGIVRQV